MEELIVHPAHRFTISNKMSLTTRINLSAVIVLLSFICLAAFALERAFFESTESELIKGFFTLL
jgi:hypothetical protein